jgi:hypothetical protein
MKGKRVNGLSPHQFAVGDYGIWDGQGWYGRSPNGYLANLTAHEIIEHPDGTITVKPSILLSGGRGPVWHGFLKQGVWEEVWR